MGLGGGSSALAAIVAACGALGVFFSTAVQSYLAKYDCFELTRPVVAAAVLPECNCDRWAIAGYIKALQLSQNAFLDDVPDEARQRLEGLEVNR